LHISGLVFTSPRAVSAFAHIKDVRSLLRGWQDHPVFVVGEQTSKILKKELDLDGQGSSAGNANALADIILQGELQVSIDDLMGQVSLDISAE
jgi:uroporphyrinogen-III synthase